MRPSELLKLFDKFQVYPSLFIYLDYLYMNGVADVYNVGHVFHSLFCQLGNMILMISTFTLSPIFRTSST